MKKKQSLNSFVVADSTRCIGCRICEIACSQVHSQGNRPLTVGSMMSPIQPRLHLVRYHEAYVPVQCRHCEDAPCANVCQVEAISQRDGVIFVDEEKCMGCKTCMLACPFGAMELVPLFRNGHAVMQHLSLCEDDCSISGLHNRYKQRLVANKCDLCIGEEQPACVLNCPQQALQLVVPREHRAHRMQAAALSLAAVGRNYSV
ncbi:4Fe-4S dicluster domain-containing protein [Desulfotalea psychrophila]|uniref:Related to iron-sulfur center hydrogenase n=1 Tax=Desulfotalea psychrophila (strain LSv54 / DSM 12343) TaxID=177439 RepID=Q6AR15_DESPS|nr:4Fe-4S dicluster domain-containing protein [Desulfotalea psychrophila]CAG35209.1 related to iron-sulfur center hydrogenase [Desulfotalea psychrophila LSv54]